MTEEQVRSLLREAIGRAIERAQPHVAQPLPRATHLHLTGRSLSSSAATPTLDEVTAALLRDGNLPSPVHLSVAGVEDGETLIEVSTEMWESGDPPRVGPFTVGGLALPGALWERPRPLSLSDLVDLVAHHRARWQAEAAWPPGTPEDERRRLWHGPNHSELPGAPGTDEVVVQCPGNAPLVLDRVRQVMGAILDQDQTDWPSTDEWDDILPEWFTATCAVEQVGDADNVGEADDAPWTIGSFVFWFEPNERQWYWWNATVQDADTVVVTVAPYDLPYAIGALKWLFYASGATRVETASGV